MIIIMIGRSTSPGLHGYIHVHFGALYQRQNLCASHRQTAVAVGSRNETKERDTSHSEQGWRSPRHESMFFSQ